MKAFSFLFLTAALLVPVVSASRTVLSSNNGDLTQPDQDAIFLAGQQLYEEGGTRRGLRRRQDDRELQEWDWVSAAYCATWCQGWAPGHCWVWLSPCFSWEWYLGRRHTQEISNTAAVPEEKLIKPSKNVRELVNTAECDALISQALQTMEGAVSDQGLPVVDNSTFTCYEICTLYDGFSLWNAHCNYVSRTSITDGALICANDYEFSIEVLADDCVDTVTFQLTGPNGYTHDHTEYNAPYTVFGDDGEGDVHGSLLNSNQPLEVGTYYLTATPDEDSGLATTLTFELIEC